MYTHSYPIFLRTRMYVQTRIVCIEIKTTISNERCNIIQSSAATGRLLKKKKEYFNFYALNAHDIYNYTACCSLVKNSFSILDFMSDNF